MVVDPHAGPGRRRGGGAPRQGEFTIERTRTAGVGTAEHDTDTLARQAVDLGQAEAEAKRSTAIPLYPARVASKYYVVPGLGEQAGERRGFADERGDYLVFRDEGTRLATRREEAVVVRDLVAIAQHREWTAVQVTGSTAFRRKVWLEATERGIAVTGYEPTDLDRQAAAKRHAEGRSAPDRATQSEGGAHKRSAPFAASPAGAMVTTQRGSKDRKPGEPDRRDGREDANPATAPQQTRAGKDRSADLKPLSEQGRPPRSEEDSPGRPVASAILQVGRHDEVLGEERRPPLSDSTIGVARDPALASPPETGQNRWKIEHDRLRSPSREAVVQDRNLAAAQSHLIVLDRVLTRAFPGDSAARQAVLDVARGRLAQHLAAGRTLRRAEYGLPSWSVGEEREGPGGRRQREVEQPGGQRRRIREKDR